ncbi:electron transfer flavoprotein subunit alpha/FixB family protein [Larsenimonas rhizosphaerae]|uniref:Electron transfer flavoprotein subunit alpha n=1 Tax=Larsenimonas rhizosphaerae TaxID=2944682 RepID=A0AA42CTU9_9GAMM|nr:FAD-binding protein [Larsenimonas rhizosphaerae]MCX2523654.1 FAD-binding protein [Larsenimonas rhizosphaerae]
MATLIFAEHLGGDLDPATARVVAAAKRLGGDIDIVLLGQNMTNAAAQAAALEGVSRVRVADNEAFAHPLAENTAQVLAGLSDEYSHILAAASTSGKNILPRLAALKNVEPLSDVIDIESEDTFKRPIYAGSAIATVQSLDALKVLSIRTTAFDPVGEQSAAAIDTLAVVEVARGVRFVDEVRPEGERPELAGARVVVSGGRGMGNGDNFRLIEAVADKLGAAIGASRAAVDAGFVPNDMQVGQTGKVVAPELYIAVGISGSIQHLAGMKDSRVIVAINSDDEAPIFNVADYGLVGDLFTVLPELAEKL